MSRRQLWSFRLISLVVFPVMTLVLLEVGLLMGGYGFPANAVVKGEVNGVRSWVSNDAFARLFFSEQLAREFDPFVMPVDKAENHCRILVLGASATQGVPDGAYAFSRILALLLEDTYPSVTFEVVNAGMTAINSHSVVQMVKDLKACRADAFVVYLGNNEVVGPYGAGTVFSPLKRSRSLIRSGITLRRYRLGQLISSLARWPKADELDHWGGMQMYLDQQVRADDPQLEIVYDHFRDNLEDICSTAQGMGAKVLLSTVGSNLRDCPPFVSMHDESLDEEATQRWQALYQQGITCEQQGDTEEAIEAYLACDMMDGQFADLHFRLARQYDTLGQFDEARACYVKARELDALRFRADNRINSIILDVAEQRQGKGVYAVDAAKALAEHSEHELPGQTLFYEHVHLTFEGNAVVAHTILQGIHDVLPLWVQETRGETADVPVAELTQRLVFMGGNVLASEEVMLDVYLRQAPFTNQLYHAEQISRVEQKVELLQRVVTPEAAQYAKGVYQTAIERRPEDWWLRWKYAELLADQFKDLAGAIEQCESVLALVPQFRRGHILYAGLLEQRGQFKAAKQHYEASLRLKPNAPAAYRMGVLSVRNRQLDEAVTWYRKALVSDRRHLGATLNLGEALSRLNRADEAIDVYRQGVEMLPDSVDLHYNLAVLYHRAGQKKAAVQCMRKAMQLSPASKEIREALKTMEQG